MKHPPASWAYFTFGQSLNLFVQAGNMTHLSDVALALELQAHAKPDQPDVTVIRPNARHNRRTTTANEEWQRGGCLGEGGYGRVYLEECISGSNVGKIQAVKKLQKARNKDYHHELNAIALFSLGKVSRHRYALRC